MLQKRGIAMKMKGTLFSLSTLALTAALLLSGCGSEKKKETSPSSTNKIAQVKQSSTSKKEEKKATSKTTQSQQGAEVAASPTIASSETQASVNSGDTKSSRSQSRPGPNSFQRNASSSDAST